MEEVLRGSSARVRLVKIDTEGAEVNVLRSLLPVLPQLDNLVVETSVGWWLRRYNVTRDEGAELYASLLEQNTTPRLYLLWPCLPRAAWLRTRAREHGCAPTSRPSPATATGGRSTCGLPGTPRSCGGPALSCERASPSSTSCKLPVGGAAHWRLNRSGGGACGQSALRCLQGMGEGTLCWNARGYWLGGTVGPPGPARCVRQSVT
eukprot:scaffold10883_cov74-Phaeocystis_antarctica.AAC.1